MFPKKSIQRNYSTLDINRFGDPRKQFQAALAGTFQSALLDNFNTHS
jgi:hypothetical protein